MLKKILLVILCASSMIVDAKELITVEFSSIPSQSNATPYLKMLDIANSLQDKYEFVLEFKPGGNSLVAMKAMDQSPTNRISTTSPAFAENVLSGQLNENDYVAITTQGDACWAVITNIGDTRTGIASLKGQKEIVVGGVGYGTSAHLAAIIISKRYGFKIRYIPYKANIEALIQMASGQPINFVIERISNYKNFKQKNPNLEVLGINCPHRNPLMPEIKTLAEQGFDVPTIFMTTLANVKMPVEKRREISQILDQAQMQLGNKYMMESADMYAPMFANPKISTEEFFNRRVLQMKVLLHRYEKEVEDAKK
jgi:tripartite-type tricarboxylate transporter receptor subunit TctC